MSEIPKGMGQAFAVAMEELGFCSTSWLFVRAVAEQGGEALVERLRDQFGRTYPVLDAVAAEWLDGNRAPAIIMDPVLSVCEGLSKLLIVGIEADFLDAILPLLPTIKIGLLRHSLIEVDWERTVANYPQQVSLVDLAAVSEWAGSRSGLLTFLYGHDQHIAHVRPAWLRLIGRDIQTQFRSIIGWNVLRSSLFVYPRWLVETSLADFSEVV